MTKLKIAEFQKEALSIPKYENLPVPVQAALIGGAGLAVTGLGNVAWQGAKHVAEPILRNRRYKAMREEYPDLEDSPTARRAFRTLHKFSPDMAADPMSAYGFVNRVQNYGELTTPEQVSTLVGVQRGMPQSPQALDQFGQTFSRELGQSLRALPEEKRRQQKHDFEYGADGSAKAEEARRGAKERRDIDEAGRKKDQHGFLKAREGRDKEEAKRRGVSHLWDKLRGEEATAKHIQQMDLDKKRDRRDTRLMSGQLRDQRRQMEEGKARLGLEKEKLELSRRGHGLKGVDTGRQLYETIGKIHGAADTDYFDQNKQDLLQISGDLEYFDPKGANPDPVQHGLAQAAKARHEQAAKEHRELREEKALGGARADFQRFKSASQLDQMRADRRRGSAKAAFVERFRR